MPETIKQELVSQLEVVKKLHEEDLAAGFSGVFLDDLLEKNIRQQQRILSGNGSSCKRHSHGFRQHKN
jgi:hypothetical protein